VGLIPGLHFIQNFDAGAFADRAFPPAVLGQVLYSFASMVLRHCILLADICLKRSKIPQFTQFSHPGFGVNTYFPRPEIPPVPPLPHGLDHFLIKP
jgi:hypothetical protein